MNITEWCSAHLTNCRPYKNNNIVAKCPKCGVDDKQFAVNYITGKFNCFREKCGFRGRSIKYLIAYVEGLHVKEVETKYDLQPTGTEKLDQIASKFIHTANNDIDSIKLPAQYQEFKFNDSPMEKRFLTYLNDRGISRATIEAFKLGYCFTGRYEDRIIIPINTLDFKAFTSRIIYEVEKEKYKNENGEWKRKALVGYNEFIQKNNLDYLIITEGPFDCLKLYEYGCNVVALQGVAIHDAQINILNSLPKTLKLIILLDPEVFNKTLDDICTRLYSNHPELYVAKLELGVDPGSATKLQVMCALSKAKKWDGCI